MLSDELVWQRIKLSLDRGNYKLAKYLVRFLSNKNKYWANSLLKVYINPKKNLISKSYKDNNRFKNTIIRLGLKEFLKIIMFKRKIILINQKNTMNSQIHFTKNF